MDSVDQPSDDSLIECGEDAAKHFACAREYRNLNHGSYGTYPLEIRSVLRSYQDRIEARPDHFVRYEYRTELLDKSRRAIAKYLDVPSETCVFVPNATTGIETVLRNLVFEPGDTVIVFATPYPAFANLLRELSRTTPTLEVRKCTYTLPVSDDVICNALETAISDLRATGKTPRLALFDTISSLPGVRMPFERLTKQCRAHGILSLIDGAHGVGQFPLHLRNLDPDFFVSNLHKWLYVPRGCAILYVPVRNQHVLHSTLPTGFGYGEGFVKNFADTATMDETPYLCVPAALAWRGRVVWGEERGDGAVEGYLAYLAGEGGRRVAEILGTEVMESEEGTLGRCAMVNVRLPVDLGSVTNGENGKEDLVKQWVMKAMIAEYATAVNVYLYNGVLWARLSAQVYLTLKDFEYAADRLRDACGRVEEGEWIS